MKFTMEFDCNNAAFDEALSSEVARILRQAAVHAEMGVTGDTMRDLNGNRIGRWEINE